MAACSRNCQKWTILCLAVTCLAIGIVTVSTCDFIYQKIKTMELNLGSDSTIEFKMWKKTPIPMYIEFYLFNWTNHEEVVEKSVKPKFEQLGPYTFNEVHIRENITFNKNHTVTYKTKRIWHFNEKRSNGSLSDKVTTINVILAAVATFVKNKHAIVRMGVNFFLEEKRINLTVTKTAIEYLFDGYDDPLLDLSHKLNMSGLNVPFDKFGWFYARNNSIEYDGTFNMYDGTEDVNKLGLFTAWNYAPSTGLYPGQCGLVKGTSGELWYPVHDASTVELFASDTCSTLILEKKGEIEKLGIAGHKYKGTDRVFDNGTKYPEMKCFSYGESLASGVRNVSACKFGAPAFVSYPHFYLSDPCYREAVENMQPDEKLHEFFISIEPETGIPLEVQAAFQINIRIEPIPRIKLLEQVKTIVIPAMWFRQTAEVNEDLASQAKLLLMLPTILQSVGYGLLGIGCLLLGVVLFITIKIGWNWKAIKELDRIKKQ